MVKMPPMTGRVGHCDDGIAERASSCSMLLLHPMAASIRMISAGRPHARSECIDRKLA
jgi:hypothetical protein